MLPDKNLGFIEAKELEHHENLSSDLQVQETPTTGTDHTDMIDTDSNINPAVCNPNELSVKSADSNIRTEQGSIELQENIKNKQKDITDQEEMEVVEHEI